MDGRPWASAMTKGDLRVAFFLLATTVPPATAWPVDPFGASTRAYVTGSPAT